MSYSVPAGPPPDVVLENARFRLVIGGDATAKSLVVKATGEEMLDTTEGLPAFSVTQDRPFHNEIKLTFPNKQTTFRANRVSLEGDVLRVGFELVIYEALIRVTTAEDYLVFELLDFHLPRHYLTMDLPPVRAMRFLSLPVRDRAHFGDWMNTSWDDSSALALMAGEPYTWADNERRHGFHILYADARLGLKLRGAKAALVASATDSFLDAVAAMERGLGLPAGVESRRNSAAVNRSIFAASGISPANVDEYIALAKRGGFRMIKIYYPDLCKGAQGDLGYAGIGDYELSDAFPDGIESLKAMLGKLKAAGISPGLHVLQTFIGFKSHYVTPVADPRLNLKRHFTLARPIGAEDDGGGFDLHVLQNPADSPLCDRTRILMFGGELLSYEGYTTEPPYRFTGVRRGHFGTTPVPHPRGEIGGVLDVCEFGASSCYIDQNTDLQDEIAAKIARIYNAGFEFLYCDGSEGVNVPQGIHVSNAQYRVWKLLDPKPKFMEGAAKSHFGWHFMSGANAFDTFPPEQFKKMIVRWPQYEAPILQNDFTRVDFGWWALFLPGEKLWRGGVTATGTQPDMWEFGQSRSVAWDCPASVVFSPEHMGRHPRRDDLLEVIRRWEDVRANGWLTPEMKERLKSPTQEHHLYLNERGEYELHDIEMLPTPAGAPEARGFLFERDGKRMIACWHTTGSGTLAIDLDAPETLPLAGVRYLETALSRDEAKSAWSRACFTKPTPPEPGTEAACPAD